LDEALLALSGKPLWQMDLRALPRRMLSSFIAHKLDCSMLLADNPGMGTRTPRKPVNVAAAVRQRVERGGERLWRFEDFPDLPFTAVAQSLSRLARGGVLQRLSKGTYYRARQTPFGISRPNPAAIHKLATRHKRAYPAGVTAANLLGFTTQNPRSTEVATSSLSLPRKLIGRETIVHPRRPEAWSALPDLDAALLDFLRRRGDTSELPPDETARHLLALLSEKGRFERLLAVSRVEPPRVRAILGAIGEQLGKPPKILEQLRASLNPLSRFDFGILAALERAGGWQAKEHH
jgi:hypothetical protein